MNTIKGTLESDLDKVAELLEKRIRERLKPGHENEFEYWQACFNAAREYPDAEYIQTKAATALTDLTPCLKS